jgi:hypothetical protein
MSLRNKFEQLSKERRLTEEAQRRNDEVNDWVRDEQRRLVEEVRVTINEANKERERLRIAEINDRVIQRSGIMVIMEEAARIKKTKLILADDHSYINCSWVENSSTGKILHTTIGKLSTILFTSAGISEPLIVARIDPQVITISAESDVEFRGADMYDREKLENAVANALLNPGYPPSSTTNDLSSGTLGF